MVSGNKGKSGGSRPQCKKILSGVKPERAATGVARCNMPLDANGCCPLHGRDIR